MAKRKETLLIEEALSREARKKRIYGCEEVTIGFFYQHKADELVDFLTMDSHEEFICYEIKVTLSDLRSKAKLSFYGNRNYLVVTEDLYRKKDKWNIELPQGVGIKIASNTRLFKKDPNNYEDFIKYEAMELKTVQNSAKRELTPQEKDLLKDSLIRTMFWKMEKFKEESDPESYRALKSEINFYKKENKSLTKKYQEANLQLNLLAKDLVRNHGFNWQDLDKYFE